MVDLRIKAYGVAAGVLALDRATKILIEHRVGFLDTHHVIPGFFDIIRSENRGAAFGLFNDSNYEWRTVLLGIVALVAVCVLSYLLWRPDRLDRYSLWGFALVLGGAAGNVFDRLVFGRVTDFLLFYIGQYQWPAFNVADSAVVIGSALLALDLFRPKRSTVNVS